MLTDRVIDGTFGEEIVYQRLGGEKIEIRGIYLPDRVYLDSSSGMPMAGAYSAVDVPLSALPWEPAKNDVVVVRGETYKVTLVKSGIEGRVTLALLKHASERVIPKDDES